jgi:hypothetical protein
VAKLGGLTGLYGLPDPQDSTDVMDEGVLEAKANTLDPEHGEYGSQSLGFGGIDPSVSPFAAQGTYDAGFTDEYAEGTYGEAYAPGDQTPGSHAAPWPRGIRQFSFDHQDELADAGIQLDLLHGIEFGGTDRMVLSSPGGREELTDYTTDRYPAPNETYQSPDIPGQLKGSGSWGGTGTGGGNADTTQGYGVLNATEEFQEGHSIRRVQHDRMPWDFTNTHGEQDVPFMGRHPVQQMPLDGPDSPYYEQGDIDGGLVPWEGRIGYPTPYEQPAEPTIVAAPADDSSDSYAWAGGY